MRYNEDWLINQYELRIKGYNRIILLSKNSDEIYRYRALIIATQEFIKDLKDLKDESI